MARQIVVAAGYKDVVLPDGFRHQAGAVVILTNAQYAQVATAVTAGVLTDQGAVPDSVVTVAS